MNRRGLLKFSGQAVIGLLAVRSMSLLSHASPHTDRLATINRMIKESGSWWMQVRDRENGKNPALVYFGDGPGFEISRDSRQRWQVTYRELTQSERDGFEMYVHDWVRGANRGDFGPGTKVGDKVCRNDDYYIRAWIKNGRKPGWNMSIEKLNGDNVLS